MFYMVYINSDFLEFIIQGMFLVWFLGFMWRLCRCGFEYDVLLLSFRDFFFFFSIFEVSICLFYGEVGVSLVI